MLSKIFSAAIIGLESQIIEIEVDTSYGLPSFNIVGLPDKAVQESRERVGSAVKSSGFQSPFQQPIKTLVSFGASRPKKRRFAL